MAVLLLNAEQCKNWEKSGKSEFLKGCRELSSEERDVFSDVESRSLKRLLYELSCHVVRGHLKQEHAVIALEEVCSLRPEVASLMADIFNVLDVENTASEDVDKTQRERLVSLIAACVCFIGDAVLKERLDQETLDAVGLVSSKTQFSQKYVKMKTKLYYKQQKFNLLREENEGYAKLLTELNQVSVDSMNPADCLENMKSLIGYFNLDPNRVLDVILEALETHPNAHSFFIPLLKSYMNDPGTLCHTLGFKFQQYQETQASVTPVSLYTVAAILLHKGLVDLDDLYVYLKPSNAEIFEQHKQEMAEAKEYARKMTVVVLSDKPEEKKQEDTESRDDRYPSNQKLGLCEALLKIGSWKHAKKIMDGLPFCFAASYQQLSSSLCQLIHQVIEQIYVQYCGLPKAVLALRAKRKLPAIPWCSVVTTWAELEEIAFPMIKYLGPHLSSDPILMAKLIRLGRAYVSKRGDFSSASELDDRVYRGFLTIIDEVLLPSLSMLSCNCCMSEDLWSLIKLFKYEIRYRLYGQWKNDSYLQHPQLVRVRADCLEKAKYIMKRLAKENVKPLGKKIGKLSHSNPGIIFEFVLSQIQKYDNFIGPVVDSLKYLTSLSYDALAFCIIEALANPEKERMKHDDTNISLWLQSLASFSAAIYRKYQIDLAGVLQYVNNQLKAGRSFDLLILREIIQKMAGIEVSEEITEDQLDSMSGGELLKQQGGYFAQVKNAKKSCGRLKDALLDSHLALPLCLMMAQQRDAIVYTQTEDNRHLKLIGKLYDQCQDVFVQFCSFLSTQLSMEELRKRLPTVHDLVIDLHLWPDAAFCLTRSLYSHSINAKFEELKKQDKKDKLTSSQLRNQRYVEASNHVLGSIKEQILPLYPPKIWEDLNPGLYVTFWTLTMFDLSVPSSAYEKQQQQLSQQLKQIEENKELPQNKKKKEKERCEALINRLQEEEKRQNEHVARVVARFTAMRDTWFVSRSPKNETISQFLQLCIFPRCKFTAIDAAYCAKFIHTLHMLQTINFSTLICYDMIFSDIQFAATSCTENEAHRYGRFLCACLDTIQRWHGDRSLYEKECINHPGFLTVIRTKDKDGHKADQMSYENYRHICHKWHFRLTKAIVACLESGNYIQIRNALIVLTKILRNYPRIMAYGLAVTRRVDRILQDEKEKRPDLYVLAMGYSGQLKSKQKTWVAEKDFHHKEVAEANKENTAQAKREAAQVRNAVIKKPETENKEKEKQKEVRDNKEKVQKKAEVKLTTQTDKDTKPDSTGKTSKNGESKAASAEKKENSVSKQTKISKSSIREKEKGDSRDQVKDKVIKEEKSSVREERIKEEKFSAREDRMKEEKSSIREERGKEEKLHNREDKEKSHGRDEKEKAHSREEKEKIHNREEKDKIYIREEKEKIHKDRKEDRYQKEEREKVKEERGSKESKSHGKEKSERSRSKDKEEKTERSASVTSNSSHGSHRRSAEPSPKTDERDSKRRKVELSSSLKDSPHSDREKHYSDKEKQLKSPILDRSLEKERERERKVERKRVSGEHSDKSPTERKRHKAEENSKGSLNGESDGAKERDKSTDRHYREKASKEDGSFSEKRSKKEGKEKESREESREKRSEKHSSKKSKK